MDDAAFVEVDYDDDDDFDFDDNNSRDEELEDSLEEGVLSLYISTCIGFFLPSQLCLIFPAERDDKKTKGRVF